MLYIVIILFFHLTLNNASSCTPAPNGFEIVNSLVFTQYCVIESIAQPTTQNPYNFEVMKSTTIEQTHGITNIKVTVPQKFRNQFFEEQLVISMRVPANTNYEQTQSSKLKKLAMIVTLNPYIKENEAHLDLAKVKTQFSPQNYVDYTAYAANKDSHYIQANLSKLNMPDFNIAKDLVFYIQFIDVNYDNQKYDINLKIDIQKSLSISCPKSCSGFGKCQSGGICECMSGYFDIDCSLEALLVEDGKTMKTNIPGYSWRYFYFPLYNIQKSVYIKFMDKNTNMNFQMIFYGQYKTTRPTFDESQMESAGEYQIRSDVVKTYNQLSLQNDVHLYQRALLIGLYANTNQNVFSSFSIVEEKESRSNSETSYLYIYIIAIVVVIVLIVLSAILLIRHKTREHRVLETQRTRETNRAQERRLMKQMKKEKYLKKYKALIKKLMPTEKYIDIIKKYPLLKEQSDCIVCLVTFEEQDDVRFTLCGHLFHIDCFEQWVIKNLNCPFCREDYGPRALMKIYKSKISGTYDELNDEDKKESAFVQRLKGKLPQLESTEFDILDTGKRHLPPTQAEGTMFQYDGDDNKNEEQDAMNNNNEYSQDNIHIIRNELNSQINPMNGEIMSIANTNQQHNETISQYEQEEERKSNTRINLPNHLSLNQVTSQLIEDSPVRSNQVNSQLLDNDLQNLLSNNKKPSQIHLIPERQDEEEEQKQNHSQFRPQQNQQQQQSNQFRFDSQSSNHADQQQQVRQSAINIQKCDGNNNQSNNNNFKKNNSSKFNLENQNKNNGSQKLIPQQYDLEQALKRNDSQTKFIKNDSREINLNSQNNIGSYHQSNEEMSSPLQAQKNKTLTSSNIRNQSFYGSSLVNPNSSMRGVINAPQEQNRNQRENNSNSRKAGILQQVGLSTLQDKNQDK